MRRWREASDRHAFEANPQESCAQMTEKQTAFGARQPGRMENALSIHDGGGSALPRKPNGGRFVLNLGNVG
jgi:hypothetical protein